MLPATSNLFIAAVLCGVLSACSGGGGGPGDGSGDGDTDGSDSRSFAGYQAEGEVLASEIGALEYTDPAALPTTGSARYDGVMGLVVDGAIDDPTTVLAGDLTLDVGFARNSMAGAVTNIVNGNDETFQGSLSVEDVYFDREVDPDLEYTYGASLSGNVTDPTGAAWEVQADMNGDFFGSDASHTAGDVYGDACSTALETCVGLEGAYRAQR